MKTKITMKKLLAESLKTIEALAGKLSTVKSALPLDHPIQNQASFNVEKICEKLERAIAKNIPSVV